METIYLLCGVDQEPEDIKPLTKVVVQHYCNHCDDTVLTEYTK